MASQTALDRIKGYLRQLTPQVRGRVLTEMERLQLCGEPIIGTDAILQDLRAEFRGGEQASERAGNPSRHFFQPLQQVLVDWPPERANPGQISRGSPGVIWEWIRQFLLPTMAREFCDKLPRLVAANNTREAQRAVVDFQTKVMKSLSNMLASTDGATQIREGLGKYTSSRATFDDLLKMMTVLRSHEMLTAFRESLPKQRIGNFDGKHLNKIRAQLDELRNKHADALPFALAILTRHLQEPWQLIRLATKQSISKNAADVAATPYAIAVEMILDHLNDRRQALCQAMRINRVVIAKDILTDIYDIEYALRVRIDQIEQSEWGKRLDALMREVALDLENEMKNIPDNLHHVLGSRSLHSHDSLIGRLTWLTHRVRDTVTTQPAALMKMFGSGQNTAS